MKNIKAAVSHHDFFTARFGLRHGLFQLGFSHNAETSFRTGVDRVFKFHGGNRRGAEFTHHNAGCHVCQIARFLKGTAVRQCGAQNTDHRITGTGHIKHFFRHRWQMIRFLIRTQ